jgi:hypothetical protein
MLRGYSFFFVSRRNLLPLFCFGEGDYKFRRNVDSFLSACVQSPLRRQQLRRSVCQYALQCNVARYTPLSRSVNLIPVFFGRTVERGSARRKVFVPEDENKKVKKNYKHISNALDWIQTHGANIRE